MRLRWEEVRPGDVVLGARVLDVEEVRATGSVYVRVRWDRSDPSTSGLSTLKPARQTVEVRRGQ